MQIREYHESDLSSVRALHSAQSFDYALPDLRNPLFLTKLVLTHDSDGVNVAPFFRTAAVSHVEVPPGNPEDTGLKPGATQESADSEDGLRAGKCAVQQSTASSPIVGAALLRLTAEAYLLLDPRAGTPRDRWQWLLALHAAAERDAWQRGLEDVHAWLPPQIAARFGKRIAQLGWRRDDSWTPYCKKLAAFR
jgi:hypothetical protein